MTPEAIRSIVDQHSCVIRGIRYQFELQWATVEKYCDPVLARHLMCVEVIAANQSADDAPARLQLFAWVARLTELPSLLTDALHDQLADQMLKRARISGSRLTADAGAAETDRFATSPRRIPG